MNLADIICGLKLQSIPLIIGGITVFIQEVRLGILIQMPSVHHIVIYLVHHTMWHAKDGKPLAYANKSRVDIACQQLRLYSRYIQQCKGIIVTGPSGKSIFYQVLAINIRMVQDGLAVLGY